MCVQGIEFGRIRVGDKSMQRKSFSDVRNKEEWILGSALGAPLPDAFAAGDCPLEFEPV